MILSDIKRYLETHGRATLLDLVHRFESDPDTVRSMLAMLERKGHIRRLDREFDCTKGCAQCAPDELDCFEWAGPKPEHTPSSRA